ncbi:MAG: DUF4920 domain-containing protein [Acidobacteriota bacterium]
MNRCIFLLLISITFTACISQATQNQTAIVAEKPANTSTPVVANEPIKRGAALGDSPVVSLAKLLEEPAAHTGKTITVEGTIKRVCQNKGCWMELSQQSDAPGVRVTFKNYGFFVPTDSKGMKVKAEGEVSLKVLSKADADHLASEGAQLKRNPDGTANEIAFVATGVELSK